MNNCHQVLLKLASSLLLFLSTSVHGHDERLVGAVSVTASLLSNVFDVVQVLEYLLRRQDLDVQIVVDIKLE